MLSRLLFAVLVSQCAVQARGEGPLRFEKRQLTDRYYCDGVTAADIDRDGDVDVVAGPFWYAGPEFAAAHEFYPAEPLPPEKSPSNSMYSFVHDFSGDGWPDILVLGRVHMHPAYWYENPGSDVVESRSIWKRHFAFERVRGESPTLVDLDADGRPQLICHWEDRWGWIEPDWSRPTEPWTFHAVGQPGDSGRRAKGDDPEWNQFYHGEGVGDVNGDGRLDLLLNDGWYAQPASREGESESDAPGSRWTFHHGRFSDDRGGAQMFAGDVDADGDVDIITALNAHGFGLAWFERLPADAVAIPELLVTVGKTHYLRHTVMGSRDEAPRYGVCFSQPHALEYADLDRDGRRDIIVGKRMWAHGPKGDVEPEAAPVVYWFQHRRNDDGSISFAPHLIDDHSGVGVQIWVADVNADERPDVLTASKLGVFVFLNRPAGD